MAIMLHKAPAAFGLTTFLLHEGLEKHRVRRHLMTFVSGNDENDKMLLFLTFLPAATAKA
jgi:hypothetical protein